MTLRNIIDFSFSFRLRLCVTCLLFLHFVYLDDFVGLAEREPDTK